MNRPTDYTDFDDVVVERLVAGQHPGELIRAADAGEAVRRLARRGYSDGQIAVRLGLTRRSVKRIRDRLEIPAALKPSDNGHTRRIDAPTRPRVKG